jgi:transcriptional regulator with XRE-family HTH domain
MKHPLTNIDYGKKLTLLRTAIFAKQIDISSKLNMSQQAYSNLENGKTHFSVNIINKLCAIFNITFQEFITMNDQGSQVAINHPDNDTLKILELHHQKITLEKDIRIVQLELELKKHKRLPIITHESAPIYVMI